ncbi:deoxyribonuclease IV [Adlercreutzia faecimuris]|uniref:Deoxyribonuclease IV n=1 Tax=Adlercreutzia faecimuris TaxID=2897341 RepID=A0ABS9WDW7_9ACTN|nr:deoxyribonuclease IV [Adlercreutzia sp. JBNU-10]MCI2241064.1 deoxyribonuclease IV [Adlercreutzia sp. JBNU-10]
MLTIGSHLSTHYGYLRMAEETVSIKGSTFQYFTRNPRGGAQRALDQKDVDAFNAYAAAHGVRDVMGYAPYDVDPGEGDVAKQDFARMVMLEDLERLALMPGSRYLVRPGSIGDTPRDQGIANASAAFRHVLETRRDVPLLLANMPGEGTQIGSTFEELAAILDGIGKDAPVGVLLDASSAYAAGYDLKNDLDGVLGKFDQAIGLDRLKAVHLNDIKEALGSDADRHAPIGEGQIGFEALAALTVHPALADVPFYLEEPKADLVMYEKDIARFQAYYAAHKG